MYLMSLDVSSPAEIHVLHGCEHIAAVAFDDGAIEDSRRRWNLMVAEAFANEGSRVHGGGCAIVKIRMSCSLGGRVDEREGQSRSFICAGVMRFVSHVMSH